jgi:membrane protease YdiL (CAAX protease family)
MVWRLLLIVAMTFTTTGVMAYVQPRIRQPKSKTSILDQSSSRNYRSQTTTPFRRRDTHRLTAWTNENVGDRDWQSSFLTLMNRLLTGKRCPSRPKWADELSLFNQKIIVPTFLLRLRPSVQLIAALAIYIFHTLVLTQHSISFPVQLIPNERGHFQSIGWDSVAGMAVLAIYQVLQQRSQSDQNDQDDAKTLTTETTLPTTTQNGNAHDKSSLRLPRLLSTPSKNELPWKDVTNSRYAPLFSVVALLGLLRAYFQTGILSLWWEDRFFELAMLFPITVAMHRSLCVLMGHTSWIVLGGLILRLVPVPQPFFQQPESRWFKSNFKSSQWLWWTMGGYFVSSWLFNISDVLNTYFLPLSVLEAAENSSVVSQLVNPEGRDWLASVVGYLAPCINAPWWEEILYRGFLLPSMFLLLGYKRAVLVSGVLFSIHHSSLPAFLPLCILGWTWAILYTKSQNLWTTIVIHAMWNSRIFLGSWLGV